jgi:hypothetical protein
MSTASPILNFTSLSGGVVTAEYANLPTGSHIVFVNQTSGQKYPGIGATGGGTVTIKVPAAATAGAYYLEATDKSGAYLAQTVVFQLAK